MNFLHWHRKHTRHVRVALARRIFEVFVSVLGLAIVGFGLYVGIYSYQAYSAVTTLKKLVATMQTLAQNKDFAGIAKELDTASQSAKDLDSALGHLTAFEYVPYIRTQYKATVDVVHIGQALINDAQRGVSVAQEFFNVLNTGKDVNSIRDISEEQKGLILGVVKREGNTLRSIEADVLLQASALSAIDTTKLTPLLADPIVKARDGIKSLMDVFHIFSPFLDQGPSILGFPEQKTYLFLMQNNSEVRGTGGFIGTYGVLKLHNGEIKEFKTDNIYNLDDPAIPFLKVAPPPPFAKYFKTNQWFLRDSNWSPDFSVSAQKAMWFYNAEGGKEKLDGVIAVSQDFIVPLLRFAGPVEVEGIVFTADNFVTELQYQVEKGFYHKGIEESQRKEIVGTLADRILQRFYKLPSNRFPEVIATMQRLVQERQVMTYFNDPALQDYARSQGWTGEFRKTDGDFVMVVDSSMAALKTDAVMDKYIDYTLVENTDGTVRGKVDLYYTNNGSFTWQTTRYLDWVRIYVPEGSVLVKSDGAMAEELSDKKGPVESGHELDKTYFGAYIVVAPRTTKHFSVEYILPSRIADQIRAGQYRLTAQKQSGVTNQQFKARLAFTRPIKTYEPTAFFNTKTDLNSVQVQSDLRVDRFFSVTF